MQFFCGLLFDHKANKFYRQFDDYDCMCSYQPLECDNHDDPVETTFERLMMDQLRICLEFFFEKNEKRKIFSR